MSVFRIVAACCLPFVLVCMAFVYPPQGHNPNKTCKSTNNSCNDYYGSNYQCTGGPGTTCVMCETPLIMEFCNDQDDPCEEPEVVTPTPADPSAGCGRKMVGTCIGGFCRNVALQENDFCGTRYGCKVTK